MLDFGPPQVPQHARAVVPGTSPASAHPRARCAPLAATPLSTKIPVNIALQVNTVLTERAHAQTARPGTSPLGLSLSARCAAQALTRLPEQPSVQYAPRILSAAIERASAQLALQEPRLKSDLPSVLIAMHPNDSNELKSEERGNASA